MAAMLALCPGPPTLALVTLRRSFHKSPSSQPFLSLPRASLNRKPTATRLCSSPKDYSELDTPVLRIFAPLVVTLGLAMLVDAAYSGDWSRIGVITTEQEVQLQGVAKIAALGHLACAAAAGFISAQRGEHWAPRAVKTLFAGFAGLVEVVLLPDSPPDSQ